MIFEEANRAEGYDRWASALESRRLSDLTCVAELRIIAGELSRRRDDFELDLEITFCTALEEANQWRMRIRFAGVSSLQIRTQGCVWPARLASIAIDFIGDRRWEELSWHLSNYENAEDGINCDAREVTILEVSAR